MTLKLIESSPAQPSAASSGVEVRVRVLKFGNNFGFLSSKNFSGELKELLECQKMVFLRDVLLIYGPKKLLSHSHLSYSD